MDMDLNGKVVIVTGASKGIGFACAQAFAAEGARVAMISRSQRNLDDALTRFAPSAHAPITVVADLTQADAAQRMHVDVESRLGAVDVLVNSAGAARRYPPADLNAAAWHDAMDAKFFTYMHATDAVLKGMVARGHGAVVNIIGNGGKVASPVHLPGGAANAALMLATTGLAAAYASAGVRINGINPGGTLTGRVQEGVAAEARMRGISEADVLAQNQSRIPMGRFAQPEEVARVAVFLASNQASYVTGAIVPMDGGAASVI
jgi:NAD(P)-dependent dehydrogenase (short-subunit alcohol dehydrogenase family)